MSSSEAGALHALKRRAAESAAGRIRDGIKLGLGTGSTVRHLLDVIAERRGAGEWQAIVCVPTSEETAVRSRRLGIPLGSLDAYPELDLTIDGADEVDDQLRLIKGLGGALLREKIVAACSRELVIVVDRTKHVSRLGTRAPVPLEVEPFGAAAQLPFLRALGARPALRLDSDAQPLRTDGGHHIIDCRFPDGIDEPAELERALQSRPGILETGLFLDMADRVIVASEHGLRQLGRS